MSLPPCTTLVSPSPLHVDRGGDPGHLADHTGGVSMSGEVFRHIHVSRPQAVDGAIPQADFRFPSPQQAESRSANLTLHTLDELAFFCRIGCWSVPELTPRFIKCGVHRIIRIRRSNAASHCLNTLESLF